MAKAKTAYVCDVCGYDTPKWVGKCPSCGSWNTMKEFTVALSSPSRGAAVVQQAGLHRDTPHPVPLSQIDAAEEPRFDTHDAELNRVLGGGIVPGSLILLGGEPGIGKSTLLLQTVLGMAERRILYVSGEESERQIKLRADRLLPETAAADGMLLLCETRMERIFEEVRAVRPELLIIDSVQTMHTETVESSPGSVTQIRECAAALLKFAKEQGVPVLLIGHITKEGSIAGPKVLEHIVDCVLQFEGDRHYFYRILRSIKNRFGSTAELGIYEMNANGLRPVDNPSELLLTQHDEPLSGVAICAALEGVRPFLIETQALVSTAAYGTPQRSATGFDLRRLNMLLAVLEKRVGFKLGAKDVFLNIAGGLRVTDPAIDLSVIAAVLSSNVDTPIDQDVAMAGECGLSGEIRPVTRIDRRIAEAMKLGFRRFLLPAQNMKSLDAARFSGIELVPVSRVEAALRELFG
ncbi:MAG: DNA repair protein RadA [Prevotellaceae bacterium]|nr:DNA repair protein RadA [Prevotellaceae bacterium]